MKGGNSGIVRCLVVPEWQCDHYPGEEDAGYFAFCWFATVC